MQVLASLVAREFQKHSPASTALLGWAYYRHLPRNGRSRMAQHRAGLCHSGTGAELASAPSRARASNNAKDHKARNDDITSPVDRLI